MSCDDFRGVAISPIMLNVFIARQHTDAR